MLIDSAKFLGTPSKAEVIRGEVNLLAFGRKKTIYGPNTIGKSSFFLKKCVILWLFSEPVPTSPPDKQKELNIGLLLLNKGFGCTMISCRRLLCLWPGSII